MGDEAYITCVRVTDVPAIGSRYEPLTISGRAHRTSLVCHITPAHSLPCRDDGAQPCTPSSEPAYHVAYVVCAQIRPAEPDQGHQHNCSPNRDGSHPLTS